MHLWTFSKSKLNLKSDRVNLVAPACPIQCALFTQCPGDTIQTGTGSEIQMYYGWYTTENNVLYRNGKSEVYAIYCESPKLIFFYILS